jgi:hypothetical protein
VHHRAGSITYSPGTFLLQLGSYSYEAKSNLNGANPLYVKELIYFAVRAGIEPDKQPLNGLGTVPHYAHLTVSFHLQ